MGIKWGQQFLWWLYLMLRLLLICTCQGYSHHHLNIFSKVQKKIQISVLEIWLLLWWVHFFQQFLEIYCFSLFPPAYFIYCVIFTRDFRPTLLISHNLLFHVLCISIQKGSISCIISFPISSLHAPGSMEVWGKFRAVCWISLPMWLLAQSVVEMSKRGKFT